MDPVIIDGLGSFRRSGMVREEPEHNIGYTRISRLRDKEGVDIGYKYIC